MRMPGYRVPILVNEYERVVDERLTALCDRSDARLFPKVGLKDVVPIGGSGLSTEDYRYALMAHFDFVVANQEGEALLAVEFDGPRHHTDPQQILRDVRKNRICDRFLLPLVRAGASSLQKADHRTLLEWLLEVFLEGRRLWQQREEYEESGDVDPPDLDPSHWDYREAWKLFETGLEEAGPLDAFAEARGKVSKYYWRRPIGCPELKGWHGKDARGVTVGHLAIEVESGKWLLSSGRCDLQHAEIYLDGIFQPQLAQDLALLGLARKLDAWHAGFGVTVSEEEVDRAVAGAEEGLFSWPNRPNHREQSDSILRALRGWGVDVDDPLVQLNVEEGLRYDDETEDEYHDRLRDLELREELRRELGIDLRPVVRRRRSRRGTSAR